MKVKSYKTYITRYPKIKKNPHHPLLIIPAYHLHLSPHLISIIKHRRFRALFALYPLFPKTVTQNCSNVHVPWKVYASISSTSIKPFPPLLCKKLTTKRWRFISICQYTEILAMATALTHSSGILYMCNEANFAIPSSFQFNLKVFAKAPISCIILKKTATWRRRSIISRLCAIQFSMAISRTYPVPQNHSKKRFPPILIEKISMWTRNVYRV